MRAENTRVDRFCWSRYNDFWNQSHFEVLAIRAWPADLPLAIRDDLALFTHLGQATTLGSLCISRIPQLGFLQDAIDVDNHTKTNGER
jgi:hypothetical protein